MPNHAINLFPVELDAWADFTLLLFAQTFGKALLFWWLEEGYNCDNTLETIPGILGTSLSPNSLKYTLDRKDNNADLQCSPSSESLQAKEMNFAWSVLGRAN